MPEKITIKIPVGEALQVVELDPAKEYMLFMDPVKVDIPSLASLPWYFPKSIQIVPCFSEGAD